MMIKQERDDMLKFDEYELRSVAGCLHVLNPHAKAYPINSLIDHMKRTAENCYLENKNFGYVSTLGYLLTLFYFDDGRTPGGVPTIKASIGDYTVSNFLKQKGLV